MKKNTAVFFSHGFLIGTNGPNSSKDHDSNTVHMSAKKTGAHKAVPTPNIW